MRPYYQDDAVTIYHGDSRELLTPDFQMVDATITDPPYGVELGSRPNNGRERIGYTQFADTPDFIKNTVIPIISMCIVLSKRVVVTPGTRNCFKYPEPNEIGAVFNPAGAGMGRWGFTCFQPILYYGKDPNPGHWTPNSFQTSALSEAEADEHPCPKPLAWMNWLVKKGSLEGETILDPFMGSGTTLRAAKDLGRKAIGIEIEERYCEIAAKRMAQEVFNFTANPANPHALA